MTGAPARSYSGRRRASRVRQRARAQPLPSSARHAVPWDADGSPSRVGRRASASSGRPSSTLRHAPACTRPPSRAPSTSRRRSHRTPASGSRRRYGTSASSPTVPPAASSPGARATSRSSFRTSPTRTSPRWCARSSVSARQSDLQVLLVDTGEHPDEEVRAAESLSREVDGFIVVSPRRLHRSLGALGSIPGRLRQPSGARARVRSSCGRRRPWPTRSRTCRTSGTRTWPTWAGRAGSWAAGERRSCGAALRPHERVGRGRARRGRADLRGGSGRRARHRRQRGVRRARLQRPDGARGRLPGCARSASPCPRTSASWASTTSPWPPWWRRRSRRSACRPQRSVRSPCAMLGEGPASRELFGELVVRHSTARVR